MPDAFVKPFLGTGDKLFPQPSANPSQILGEFRDDLADGQEYLVVCFSPSSVPLQQRWRNNGLSADFLADYLATFFPVGEGGATDTRAEVKSAVSYIANELLENAMKFNDEASPLPISIRLQMREDQLVFFVANSISSRAVSKFQAFIRELLTSDPGELYIRQLERNAQSETLSGSGLGFLTMMNDYLAKLGWKFETVQKDPDLIRVTTRVQLTI